jgi:hypothetical protein
MNFLKKYPTIEIYFLPYREHVISITKTDRIILFTEGIALRAVRNIWIHPVGKASRFAVLKKTVNIVIIKGLTV